MKYVLKGYLPTPSCFEGDTCRVLFQARFKTAEAAEEGRIERMILYKDLKIEEVGE